MSPYADESEWVENELQMARELRKPIFPLLLDGSIWWHLRSTQTVNVADGKLPPENFFIHLASSVARHQASLEHLQKATEKPKNEGISLHIEGNVSGNIIIGNENAANSGAAAPAERPADKAEPHPAGGNNTQQESPHPNVQERWSGRALDKVEPLHNKIVPPPAVESQQAPVTDKQPAAPNQDKTFEIKRPVAVTPPPKVESPRPAVVEQRPTPSPAKPTPRPPVATPHKWNPAWIGLIVVTCILISGAIIGLPTLIKNFPKPATQGPQVNLVASATAPTSPTKIILKDMPMELIPAGSFMMGSNDGSADEKPPHSVTLPAFYIDKYEVTNSLYKDCVVANGCSSPSRISSYYDNSEFNNFPVIYVTWNNAKTYCEWRGGRLPTEAEWEYAARGTDGRAYPWGNDIDASRANYSVYEPTAVDSYETGKSPFGLYNMAGNVLEWVNDWYDEKYYQSSPSINPQGPATGLSRVIRGGASLYNYPQHSADRYWGEPNNQSYEIGFRCARSP